LLAFLQRQSPQPLIVDKIIKFLKIVLKLDKLRFIFILLLSSTASFFELFGIGLFYPFLDLLLEKEKVFQNKNYSFLYDYLNFSNVDQFIFVFGLASIFAVLISSIVSIINRIYSDKYTWDSNTKLIMVSFGKYVSMPYSQIKKLNSTDTTNNIIYEATVFVNGVLIPVIQSIPRIVILLMSIFLLTTVNFAASFLSIIILSGIYFGIIQLTKNRLNTISKKRVIMYQSLYDFILSSIKSIKDIKVNHAKEAFSQKAFTPANTYSNLNKTISIISTLPKYILEGILFTAVMSFMLYYHKKGNVVELVPLLSIYAIAAFRLLPHVQTIFSSYTKIKFNLKSLDIIYNSVTKDFEVKTNNLNSSFNLLEVKNITYNNPEDGDELFRNISLSIKKGNFYLIQGKSGSGKSTLFQIILGLIKSNSGNIFLNKEKLEKSSLFENINVGYVSQDIVLFDDTLKNNIKLYEKRDYSEEWLNEVLEITCLSDFVAELENGLDHKLIDGGGNLSIGQRQRVSLARSIYKMPDILFLDEATSGLDIQTENLILKKIKSLRMTVIMISHNKNISKLADKVFDLQKNGLEII